MSLDRHILCAQKTAPRPPIRDVGRRRNTVVADLEGETNAMTPTYAAKLGLTTHKTDVDAQRIDGSALVTYEMVIAGFSVQNKLGKVRFFEETFLLADTSMAVVLGMPFLTFSNADMWFARKELEWRSYTTAEALPTANRVELIDKREVSAAALDGNEETPRTYRYPQSYTQSDLQSNQRLHRL